MAVTFFDGFDGYQNLAFTLASAEQTVAGWYWWYNAIYRTEYVSPGYIAGRAGWINTIRPIWFQRNVTDVKPGTTALRVGFWAKGGNRFSTANWAEIVRFVTNTGSYALGWDYTGHLNISYNADGDDASHGTVTHTTSDIYPIDLLGEIDWHHYEFYVDFPSGVLQCRVDGVLVIDRIETEKWTPTDVRPIFGDLAYVGSIATPPWDFFLDHVYFTDGDPLPTDQDIIAVGVVGSQDSVDTGTLAASNPGLKGNLTINGVLYQSPTIRTNASSNNTDNNYQHAVHHQWMSDPSGGEWSQAKLDSITSFGLCYGAAAAGNDMRVDMIFLEYLDYNGGLPLVRYLAPGAIDTTNTVWTKSDTDKTFVQHINDIPSTLTQSIAATDSLYVNAPGCIKFTVNKPDDPVLATTGITFAEEYREDYHDWVRVFGNDGLNYDSSFISGYGIYGEGNKQFQNNYATVNYEMVADGVAYIQGLWDYTLDPDTGRWSMKQNVYRDSDDETKYKHGSRKLKIRGSGRALQLRVLSKEGKPFVINGWSLFVTGETAV